MLGNFQREYTEIKDKETNIDIKRVQDRGKEREREREILLVERDGCIDKKKGKKTERRKGRDTS